jgi:hypothetical protein
MKNSTQVIAIVLFLFSNVISASGLIKKENLPNVTIFQIKTVSFADANLFHAEVEGLSNYVQTIADVMQSDKKITENETMVKANSFVSYDNEELLSIEFSLEKTELCIESQIKNDLKTTESALAIVEQFSFINYANSNILQLELDTLKISKSQINDIISANLLVIEAEISNAKIEILKLKDHTAAIKKAIRQ